MSSPGSEDDEYGEENAERRHESPIRVKQQEPDSDFEDIPNASDYEERPGRFIGPDSTWRSLAEEAIATSNALDQEDNDDLSIHLYNTHAWKKQHRDDQHGSNVPSWRSKQQWLSLDENGELPFLPTPKWSAWPMSPIDVPRRRERFGVPTSDPSDDPGTYFKREAWRPSLHMEEEINAVLLRNAHTAFKQREWQVDGTPEPQATQIALDHTPGPNSDPEDNSLLDDLERPNGSADEADKRTEPQTTTNHTPAFMADDETAHEILRPTARHVLSKVDDILVALHQSRKGHWSYRSTSRGHSKSSRSRSKSASRPQTPNETATKRRARALDDEDDEYDDDPGAASPVDSETTQRARARSRFQHEKLGLRDWSEVLGFAAITGWDPAVLDRAARRCAALFGETMSLRTMTSAPGGQSEDQIIEYVPDMVPPIEQGVTEDEDDDVDKTSKELDTAGYPCPFSDCPRHAEPYDKLWRLREHLKRKHKHNKEPKIRKAAGADYDATDEDDEEQLPQHVKKDDAYEDAAGFPCPFAECERHENPFEKRFRLNEHIKRKHAKEKVRAKVPAKVEEEDDAMDVDINPGNEEEEQEVQSDRVGPIPPPLHTGDFLQPITLRIGRSKDRAGRASRSKSNAGSKRGRSRKPVSVEPDDC